MLGQTPVAQLFQLRAWHPSFHLWEVSGSSLLLLAPDRAQAHFLPRGQCPVFLRRARQCWERKGLSFPGRETALRRWL